MNKDTLVLNFGAAARDIRRCLQWRDTCCGIYGATADLNEAPRKEQMVAIVCSAAFDTTFCRNKAGYTLENDQVLTDYKHLGDHRHMDNFNQFI